MKKLALLDTDFISKTYMVKAGDGSRLIDNLLRMSKYSFSFHERIREELEPYKNGAGEWLDCQAKNGLIEKYTDERMLMDMKKDYGKMAAYQYTWMTKNASDSFKRGLFEERYQRLAAVDYTCIEISDYLSLLHDIEAGIGRGSNLGELKTYILLQWMDSRIKGRVYYFCSDDSNARKGILGLRDIDIQCISLLSLFQKLWQEGLLDEERAKPFIQSVVENTGNSNVAVIEASEVGRWIRVPYEQALQEIFEGKYIELKNGMLKYRE